MQPYCQATWNWFGDLRFETLRERFPRPQASCLWWEITRMIQLNSDE